MTPPSSPALAADLAAAVDLSRRVDYGEPTGVYPALARVDRTLRAGAVHPVAGEPCGAGDVDAAFILMSVVKPLALALAVDAHGRAEVLERTGMTASPYAFNDPAAITSSPDGRTNPMVNPGAITVASLLAEESLVAGLSAFAGRPLEADPTMVDAIHATNHRNRELASLLAERHLLGSDVEAALHRYTLECCLHVTVVDLARMGAVLATGGVDPVSGARVVSAEAAALAIDAMRLAGMYQATDAWMEAVGLPAKSGIAGGLLAVAPGVGAIAAYSPPLDSTGNPLGAQAVVGSLAPLLR